ncbi:hypothetical protein [Rathayibacter sp. VKM Ac-2801]|uniref:hypothetical protein n=1 Tax=Rathayibacter sp. VKM Ac-2801 TaxID=2609255 RepID=UPI00131F6E1F|nr:hypothetical protein [Rathayibacter sp. VKM Ac-2801]QHC71037.1 hypothetical protein GSU45_12085 [Rathayibacter sp. VKM Ac-2801]
MSAISERRAQVAEEIGRRGQREPLPEVSGANQMSQRIEIARDRRLFEADERAARRDARAAAKGDQA